MDLYSASHYKTSNVHGKLTLFIEHIGHCLSVDRMLSIFQIEASIKVASTCSSDKPNQLSGFETATAHLTSYVLVVTETQSKIKVPIEGCLSHNDGEHNFHHQLFIVLCSFTADSCSYQCANVKREKRPGARIGLNWRQIMRVETWRGSLHPSQADCGQVRECILIFESCCKQIGYASTHRGLK